MNEVLLAIAAGCVVGVSFACLWWRSPAAPVLSGVVGMVGVYLGGIAYSWILTRFFS